MTEEVIDLIENMDPDFLESILRNSSSPKDYQNASKIVRLVFNLKIEELIQKHTRSATQMFENPALFEESFICTKLSEFYNSFDETDECQEEYRFVEDNFDSIIKIQGQFISHVLALKDDLTRNMIRKDVLKGHQRMFAYLQTQNIEPNPFIVKSQKGIQTLYKLSSPINKIDLPPVIANGRKIDRMDKIATLLEKGQYIDSSIKFLALFDRNTPDDLPNWLSKPSQLIFLFYLFEEQFIIPEIVLKNLKSIVCNYIRDNQGQPFKDNSINQAIKRRKDLGLSSRAYLSKIKLKDYQELYYIVTRMKLIENQQK